MKSYGDFLSDGKYGGQMTEDPAATPRGFAGQADHPASPKGFSGQAEVRGR